MKWEIQILDPRVEENPPELSETYQTQGITEELVAEINEFLKSCEIDTQITLLDLRSLSSPSARIGSNGFGGKPTGRPKIERIAKWLKITKIYSRKIYDKKTRKWISKDVESL